MARAKLYKDYILQLLKVQHKRKGLLGQKTILNKYTPMLKSMLDL